MRRLLGGMFRAVGRLLRPIFHPDLAEEQKRVRDLAAGLAAVHKQVARLGQLSNDVRKEERRTREDLAAAHRDGLVSIAREMEKGRHELEVIKARVVQIERDGLRQVEDRMIGLRATVTRHTTFTSKVLKRQRPVAPHSLHIQRAFDRLERLAKQQGPIVVGPWTGEVGFELVYWAPFVRWAVATFNIDPARVTLLSRGGTRSWYDVPAAAYRDVFDLCTPEEFRAGTEHQKKQRLFREFDRVLLRRFRAQSGSGRVGLIHPAMMYRVFMPYFRREAPMSHVLEYAHPRRVAPPALPDTMRLPDDFVAVRFYYSDALPETAANRAFIAATIAHLLESTDVVLLDPGVKVDDHSDASGETHPRLHRIDHVLPPARNLEVQTAVLARARAFVGTYGGYAYLAPLCGVPALAFYSTPTFYVHHLELARQMVEEVHGGSLVALNTADAPLVAQALGGAVAVGSGEVR